MDYKEPRTRTETKKQGKRGGGPYSAKHVRMAAAVTAEKGKGVPPVRTPRAKLKKSAEVGRGR